MMRWYAAYTQPQGEMRAARELRQQGLDAFLPLERRLRRHARRTDAVLRPLFPRYLFVAMDIQTQRWRSVDGTRGVVHLVRHGERPAPVPVGVVENLRARADAEGTVPVEALALFAPGQRLQVVAGPFAGLAGSCHSLTADRRVVLLLELLGRPVTVAVPSLHVDAA